MTQLRNGVRGALTGVVLACAMGLPAAGTTAVIPKSIFHK